MRQFGIKELERFSGVKAHTIRAWEKRFKMFVPGRSTGNTRHYTLEDVSCLLNIAFLIRNGFKISELACLSSRAIANKCLSPEHRDAQELRCITALAVSMFSNDIEAFEDVLNSCVRTMGIDAAIREVIIPFVEKANILSYKDTSCQTHFAVTAIRHKLIVGIESVPYSPAASKKALLFLPAGEHYDLMLLYINYTLRCKGITTLYLGTNISGQNLEYIVAEKKPDCLYTYMVPGKSFIIPRVFGCLTEQLPQLKLKVVVSEAYFAPENVNVSFFHYHDLQSFISC